MPSVLRHCGLDIQPLTECWFVGNGGDLRVSSVLSKTALVCGMSIQAIVTSGCTRSFKDRLYS